MASEESVGPYRIIRPLGKGGMGEVSLAYDARLKRNVALKSLVPRDAASPSRARLIHEARAAAALSHQGIASIYDIIEDGDRAYMVMEYVEGQTLAERLWASRLTHTEATSLAVQLCEAVGAAHAQGIIHRDLKPGNIMLTKEGRPKVLDFGLARLEESPDDTTTTELSPASRGMVGTIGYIAPEQIRGTGIDHRCDIYGLGSICFEMFTGRRAFIERDPLAYALAVTTQDPPRADAIDSRVSVGLAEVLARALSRTEAGRYNSAADFARDLQRVQADETITMERRAPVPAKRSGWFAIAMGATAVLIAAIAGWPAIRDREMATPVARASLAVLPATSLGADDASVEAAGLTGILAANLSQVRNLDVLPITEAPLTNGAADIAAAIKKRGAAWGLQTTLRRAGGALTIDAQLVNGASAEAAWSRTFKGEAITAQQQLLEGIATGLQETAVIRRIPSDERVRMVAWPTKSGEAFADYSMGLQRMGTVSDPGGAEAAIKLFRSATERDDHFALAFAGLSNAYWMQYQRTRNAALVDDATAAARSALAIDPTLAAVHQSLGTMHFQTGRLDEALQAADRALALQPSSADAHRLRGRILAQSGQIDEGLRALDKAIELRPNEVVYYETKGFVLYRAGRYVAAADAYRRVTVLAPNYSTGYQMLGTSLHKLGDMTQAIGNYEHAVRVGPSPAAYSNLALSYYEVGRFEDAAKAYQEVIARDPKRPVTHRNLADVYAAMGRQAEARTAYETAITAGTALLAVNSADADTISLIALCEAQLGRRTAAERHAAEASALRPGNQDVAVRTAEVYAILRQPDRAIASLRAAMAAGYEPGLALKNEQLRNLRGLPAFIEMTSAKGGPATQGGR